MPVPETDWEQMVTEAMGECVDVFGEGEDGNGTPRVTIQHAAGGAPYDVDGIFESESIDVDPDTGVQVISNQPAMSFALADLQQDPLEGDTLIVRGITYRVVEPTYDGQGTVTLRLHRV